MRFVSSLAAFCLMTLALGGCASHPSASAVTTPPPVAKAGQTGVGDEQFVPPRGAQWTIVCTQFKGYGHVERAKALRQQLTAQTGLPAFYVVHEDEVSELFYGFYQQFQPSVDPVEGGRAQADLAKIRSLQNGVGDALFPACGITALEQPDPVSPPDWNLLNVDAAKADGDPTKAAYTVEIAIFKDSPERKQAAVDTVAAFREQGMKNVYYYHGKTSSSVCIGTWPLDAVEQIQPERGSADERVLVMPQNTPAGMGDKLKDSEGNKIRAVSLQYKPIDPTMIQMMQDYPRRAVNGYDIKHTYNLKNGSGTVDRFDPSLIVYIPRPEKEGGLAGGDRDPSSTFGAADNGVESPQGFNASGGNRLRSLNQ